MGARLPWVVGAAVAAAFLFLLRDAALGGRIPGDVVGTHDVTFVGTVLEQAAAQVRDGRAPLWFPEFDCGTPLAAAWMYGLLYPGLLLFTVLPLGAAWTVTAALHAGFGAAGMTSFLRRRGCDAAGAAGGAVLLALSEYVVGRTVCGHLNLVLPLAWAPWVLRWIDGCVRGERRAVPLLGLSLAAGMVSGHVQAWFYLGPLALAFAAAEATTAADRGPAVRRLALGGLLALGLAAAQIAITAEFLALAAPVVEDPQVVYDVSAPPRLVLSKLLGGFLGAEPPPGSLDPRPEARGIAGIWAFGLAAWGVARGAPKRWFWTGAAVFAMVAAVGLRSPVSSWIQDVPPFSFGRAPARFLVVAVVAVSALAGHGISSLPLRGPGRAAVAVACALLAIVAGTPPFLTTTDAVHRWEVADRLPPELRGHRLHSPVLCQWVNVERQGLETLRTPCFVRTAGYADLLAEPSPAIAYWLDVGAGVDPEIEWGPAGPTGITRLSVQRYEPMGRARFFGDAVGGRPHAEVLQRLRKGERALFVDGDAGPPSPPPGAWAKVTIAGWTPGEIRLDVDASGPGWLLVSTKLYPGWTASIDGAAAPLRRANLAFPAVRVESVGRHSVVLSYGPAVFRAGAAVSLASLAAALLLLLRDRRVSSAA